MYNRALYNRILYNHAMPMDFALETTVRIFESLDAVSGPGAALHSSPRLMESLSGKAALYSLLPISGALKENLSGSAHTRWAFVLFGNLREFLSGKASSSAVFHPQIAFIENLSGTTHSSMIYIGSMDLRERLQGHSTSVYALIMPAAALFERLNGYASGHNYEEIVFQLSGEVPAGSTLIIDSDPDILDVLLNNQSIIHQKTGKWPYISREIVEMLIDFAGSVPGVGYEVTYYDLYL